MIDGSSGEGGGQIVRTALSLAAISGRAIRIEKLRARRPRPGLAAQHVTAARALAAVCGGALDGDELDSPTLSLLPGGPPQAGDYEFDVAAARKGGSAGAVSLILQAMLLPLAFAKGTSTVTLHGGTHMAWSPSVHYLRDVWLPALGCMGVVAEVELLRWGWFPIGGGTIRARIEVRRDLRLAPLTRDRRGPLKIVQGEAVAANLPAHIAERMAGRAAYLLEEAGLPADIRARVVEAACAGAGLFLTAHYEGAAAGFTGLGKRGKPAETVAEEAVAALLAHHRSGAACDVHLADQLVLPAALAEGESAYTVARSSRHLETCLWLVEQFGIARGDIAHGEIARGAVARGDLAPQADGTYRVTLSGRVLP